MKNLTCVWRNIYNTARATHSRYYKHFAKHACDFSLILLEPCNFLYLFNDKNTLKLTDFFSFPKISFVCSVSNTTEMNKRNKIFYHVLKSILKLVKLQSLIVKCCKIRKIYLYEVRAECYHFRGSFTNFKMLFPAVVKDMPRSKFSLLCKLSIVYRKLELQKRMHSSGNKFTGGTHSDIAQA